MTTWVEWTKFGIEVIGTAATLYGVGRYAAHKFSDWVFSRLDPHMNRIEAWAKASADSSEKSAQAVTQMAGYHRDSMEAIRAMQTIFHDHAGNDDRVQQAILTGIEVLKVQKAAQ
jgi:hypothetical protein